MNVIVHICHRRSTFDNRITLRNIIPQCGMGGSVVDDSGMVLGQFPYMTKEDGAFVVAFKPALLRGAVRYDVSENGLSVGPEGAPDWSLRFSEITALRVVETVAQGHRLQRLDISVRDRLHRISLTVPTNTSPEHATQAAYDRVLFAVLQGVAHAGPDVPVFVGEARRARWAMFGIGVVSFLFAAGILIAALVSGLSSDRLIGASVPIAVLALFGVVLINANAPWRPELSIPAGVFVSNHEPAKD